MGFSRILKWVAISFSRGSSQPINLTWVSGASPALQTDCFITEFYFSKTISTFVISSMSSATGLLFFQELDYIFKTVFWGRNRRMTMDSEKKKRKKICTGFTHSDWQPAHSRAVNYFIAFQMTLLPTCLLTVIWEHLKGRKPQSR